MSNFFRKLWNSREFVWQFKLITKPLRLGLQQKNWLSVNWSPVNWLELTIQIKMIQEDLFTIIEKLFINRLTLEFQDGRRWLNCFVPSFLFPSANMLFLFSNEWVLSKATAELSPVLHPLSQKQKKTTVLLGKMYWEKLLDSTERNQKLLQQNSCLLFLHEVDCKTGHNFSVIISYFYSKSI